MDVTGRDAAVEELSGGRREAAHRPGRRETRSRSRRHHATIFDDPGQERQGRPARKPSTSSATTCWWVSTAATRPKRCSSDSPARRRTILRSLAAYPRRWPSCKRRAGRSQPEIRWFAEPFGLTYAVRTLDKAARLREDKDLAKILARPRLRRDPGRRRLREHARRRQLRSPLSHRGLCPAGEGQGKRSAALEPGDADAATAEHRRH